MPLVPADSPLLKVPTALDRRTVLYLDGIRYSMHIFDIAFERFTATIQRLSNERQEPGTLAHSIAEAFGDAWLLVDAAHRLRELVQQLPGLKQKQPTIQLFLRRTAPIEDLRHFVQHFRSGIDTHVQTGHPLWGTLSWTRTNPTTGDPENFTIAPGTFFDGAIVPMCTFDSLEFRFVQRVKLQVGSLSVDLANVYDQVAEFAAWYTDWFSAAHPNGPHHGADFRTCFVIKRLASPPSANEPTPPPSEA